MSVKCLSCSYYFLYNYCLPLSITLGFFVLQVLLLEYFVCFVFAEIRFLKFFFNELEKAVEYLELYGVKVGLVSSKTFI